MRITLVRHAESKDNAANIYGGQSDTGLTDRGRRQCAFLATRRERFDDARIIASDLARATETLHLVLGAGVNATLDPAWRERDWGGPEGMPADAARARYPALLDFEGGGWFEAKTEDGESNADLDRRVSAAFEEIMAGEDGHVAVFTHGGPILLTICAVLGLDPARTCGDSTSRTPHSRHSRARRGAWCSPAGTTCRTCRPRTAPACSRPEPPAHPFQRGPSRRLPHDACSCRTGPRRVPGRCRPAFRACLHRASARVC